MSVRWKLILAVGLPVLMLAAGLFAWDSWRLRMTARELTRSRFEQLVARFAAEFEGRFEAIAQVPRSAAAFMELHPHLTEAEIYDLLRRNVQQNGLIYGSCLAFEPHSFDERRLFAPYVYHGPSAPIGPDGRLDTSTSELLSLDVADAYDYTRPEWAWYHRTRETGTEGWTEPFFDAGAGDVGMVTFVAPFRRDGEFLGVVTVDVRLEQLTALVAKIGVPDARVAVLSASGKFISYPDRSLVMKTSVFEVAERAGFESLARLGRVMVGGNSGMARVERLDIPEPHWVFYAPIRSSGWSIGAAIPERAVLAPVTAQLRIRALAGASVVLLILLLMLMLGLYITRPLKELVVGVRELASGDLDTRVAQRARRDEIGQLAAAFNTMTSDLKRHVEALAREAAGRESVESELRVARDIQASMLPRHFPGGPAYRIYGISASARYVGGDFFDCFESAGELTIVIGDVSGKGVPAAMFMAMARTIVRDLALSGLGTAAILKRTNEQLIPSNTEGMFVTMLIGRYNPATGRLRYANGGHPPPYIVSRSGARTTAAATGTVVGVIPDQAYTEGELELRPGERLFLYTDGVTEARDPTGEMFTTKRVSSLLWSHAGVSAEELCRATVAAIDAFQGPSRADDATVLVLERTAEA